MQPEQFFYGPYGEMQRLTPPTRVGYAGSGEKKRMQNDGNREQQTTQQREESRAATFEQYLKGIFNDLKSIGQIDRRYHDSFQLWQSAPENRAEVARYVAEFNKEWAMGRISGGVGQIPLEQQLTPEQLAAFQQRQPDGESPDQPTRSRTPRRSKMQNVIRQKIYGPEEDYTGKQIEASAKMQSFDSVEEMFFALAHFSRDPKLWYPDFGTSIPEDQKTPGDLPAGKFPLVTVTGINEETGEFNIVLNEGNIMRFVRHYVNFYSGESPYGTVDFFGKLVFEAGGRMVNLYQETAIRKDTMFRTRNPHLELAEKDRKDAIDEENGRLGRLADNIAKEVYAMQVIRNHGLEISRQRRNVSGQEYVKLISQAFTENRLTDPYWGQDASMISFLATLAQNFSAKTWKDNEGDPANEIEHRESDNKLGFAFLGMVETIMLLADREGMVEAFPHATESLLSFEKLKEAIAADAKGRGEDPTVVLQELREKNIDHFREAEENPSSHHYMSVINIFNNPQKDQHIDRAVRKLIRDMIGKEYGLEIKVKDEESADPNATKDVLDDENLGFVFLYAEHFANLTGVTSMLDTEMKFPSSDVFNSLKAHLRDLRKMGYSGPATTWNTFNMTGIPLFWAAKTSSGKSLAEMFVDLRKKADETTMSVKEAEKEPDEETKKKNIEKAQQAYQRETTKLHSGLNQQSRYVDKFLTHAVSLQEMMSSGKMIHWQEYTEYDPIERQYVLKEFEFGQQVQNEILKKIYEMYLTYEHIDFKQPYRMQQMVEVDDDSESHGGDHGGHGGPKKKQIPYIVEVPLAVAMFGREVLDIPSFWKTDEHGRPVLNMMGEREIDVDKVNNTEGRVELAKSVFLNIVAGQIFAHRQKYSMEHKYGSKFYRSVITSLKSIHEQQFRDPNELKNLRFTGHAFHRHHLKWLRQKARITEMQLWRMDMWRDLKRKGRWTEVHKGVTSHMVNAAKRDAA